MKCIIVASGQSAKGFSPPVGIPIIAVNGVIDWIKRADYWFTLDPSRVNIRRMKYPRKGVEYHAAVPGNTNLPNHVVPWCRVEAPEGSHTDKIMNRYRCVLGLNTEPGHINTGNSAYGALGLAYHLGFTDVLLVGVDATQDPRIEGGKPNDLSHLPELFGSTKKQIKIRSAGLIQGIEKITIKDWINES